MYYVYSRSLTAYTAKSPYGIRTYTSDNYVKVYKWESGYAVTYNNGGHGTAPSSTTAASVTLSAITGVTGYTCTGWTADVAVTVGGSTISAGTLITNGSTATLSQATTFTAQWSAKTTTVSFNQNSGTGGQTSAVTATYDAAMPTPITCPTREHYDFEGYYDGVGGTGTQYYTNTGTSAQAWNKDAATATLYAKWTEHGMKNYRTMCCTELGVIGGTVTYTNPTEAVLTWNSLSNVADSDPYTITYRTGSDAFGDDNVGEITTNGSGKKTCTITNLSCNTDYDFKISVKAASGYCDVDSVLEDKNSGKWNVAYTLNGVKWADGIEEGDNVCGNFSLTVEPTSSAYAMPSTITVTIGGDEADAGDDYDWDDQNGVLTIDEEKVTGDIAVTIEGIEVGCVVDPSVGAASLSGTFDLSTVGVTVATSAAGAYCEWVDYGFVWGTSANPALNADGTAPDGVNKEQIGTSGAATTWSTSLTSTFTTGTTYYFRAYGKNGKAEAAYVYGTGGSFTPRSVTFNSNGGSEISTEYVNSGETVSAPSSPTRTGYTFNEWQLSGSTYDFSSAVTANITLVADWTPISYTITLDNNNATTGSQQTVSATYDAAMPLNTTADGTPAVAALSRTGYTFTGWWDAVSEGKQYYSYTGNPAAIASASNWDKTSATTLKAQWSANSYLITLANEGADEGDEGTETISVTYDANTNLTGTITKPVKTGYLFDGYYTGASGNGLQIIDANGAIIADVTDYTSGTKQWIYADDVTLKANWIPIYTVTWSVNDAKTTEPIVQGEQVSALPTPPTSADCDDSKKFIGWRATAIDDVSPSKPGGIFTTVAGSPTIEDDVTFYAVFADVTGGNELEFKLPFDNRSSCGVSNYTSTWTAEIDDASWTVSNFNNNNFTTGWTSDIRCGRNGSASIASITTDNAVGFRVDSVYITLTLTDNSYINEARLEVSSSSDMRDSTCVAIDASATGTKGVKISSPATGKYYRVVFDCKSNTSNGFERISSIVYRQKLDTANYVTSCSECTAIPTFNDAPAISDHTCESAMVTATDGLASLGEGDGCNIREYGFVWGTGSTPTVNDNTGKYAVNKNIDEDTEWNYEITALDEGTHYYVRAYAQNKFGTAYSDAVSFYTLGLNSLEISTAPTKTYYIAGETYDPTGMAVTAELANGDEEDVTELVTYSDAALTAGIEQDFPITYTLCETEKTANQTINVFTLTVTEGSNPSYGEHSESANIITISSLGEHKTCDFAVTNGSVSSNGDGTYTVTPNGDGNVSVTINYRDAELKNVYYKVNGVTLTSLTQERYESETTTLPDEYDLASAMSSQSVLGFEDYPNFVGWTATPFYGQATEPDILTSSPIILTDITYHAVFTNQYKIRIDEEIISGSYASEETSFSAGGYTDGFVHKQVMKSGATLQIYKDKTNYGYIYNQTALPTINRIVAGYGATATMPSSIDIFACSDKKTTTGSALTAETRGETDPYVYLFPENISYFIMKGDNNYTYKIDYLDIYYSVGKLAYVCQTRDYTTEGNWSTAANWSGGVLPGVSDVARIQVPVTMDVANTQVAAVIIDKSSTHNGKLTIGAGKELVVDRTIKKATDGSTFVATSEEDLIIGSDDTGNGALVMGSHDGTNKATVNFYSLSTGSKGSDASVNQYVGTPFNDADLLHNWYNSWIYEVKYNTGADPEWKRINTGDDMNPFDGYCVIYNGAAGHIYQMEGTLVSTADRSISLRNNEETESVDSKNENILANSWTAPISIAALGTSDALHNCINTVYIFNSGSLADLSTAGAASQTATSRGQWITIPVSSLEWSSPTVKVIPSMQSFSVYTTASDASIDLDYSALVYDPAVTGGENGAVVPNRSPRRTPSEDTPAVIRLRVDAESGYGDQVVLLEREDFAAGFENGWDGHKLFGENEAPQLYTVTPDGNMAINCVPDADGAELGFRAGSKDQVYTFSFDYDEQNETLYIYDRVTHAQTRVVTGNTYTFAATDKQAHTRFVLTRNGAPQIATGVGEAQGDEAQGTKAQKFIEDDKLFILLNGRLYDTTGRRVR